MVTAGASTTWFYYVDESYDDSLFCLSAIGLKSSSWRTAFEQVKEFRKQLKISDDVLMGAEIHARDLVRGRGRLGPKIIGKWRRSRIYGELLELAASLPDIRLFNVCLPKPGRVDPQLDAWERLLNRIDRTCEETMRKENASRRTLLAKLRPHVAGRTADEIERRISPYFSRAVVIADRGRESEIVRLRRKLSVVNFMPSQFGSWSGAATRNIPLTNFTEDVMFQDSAHSYMIQLVDCVVFSLLKRETKPTPQIMKYGIEKLFDKFLTGICVKAASPRDPLGIVRN